MKRPTLEDIITLHDKIVEQSGGSQGIRDLTLIDSAINTPFPTFGGFELYPTFEEKAARLAYNLTYWCWCFDFFSKNKSKKVVSN